MRRRLAQYYAEEGAEQDAVRIELPIGTYVPEFRWEPPPSPKPQLTHRFFPRPPVESGTGLGSGFWRPRALPFRPLSHIRW